MTLLVAALYAGTAHAAVPACASLEVGAVTAEATRPIGTAKAAATLWLRLYRKLISPGNGDTCVMQPSCSAYAVRAVDRNGPMVGSMMATSRILRAHAHPTYPMCSVEGRLYHYNPPNDDEFWRR